MCGITGFSGRYATNKALSMTLAQLSRGVQGAGVAFIDPVDHSLQVLKKPCHPVKFAVEHHYFWGLRTYSAISHNRQPSKGEVNAQNSHPFVDCKGRFALIHNGTVFGTDEIRAKLIAKGHRIEGETDSEAVAHLICEYLNEGGDMLGAMHMLMKEHPCTILVLTAEGDIYGLKASYPLWVCEMEADERNDAEVAIASERRAIETAMMLENRKFKLIELEHDDILHVRGGKLLELDRHEKPKLKEPWKELDWQTEPPTKPFFLENVQPDQRNRIWGYNKKGQRVALSYPKRFDAPYPNRHAREPYPSRR